MSKADLHIHTTASDGLLKPKEAISEAVRLKLSTIAITDHDTLQGTREAQKHALEADIRLIPGVEITALFCERECHMLAYDFDVDDHDFKELITHNKYARLKRARWIISRLEQQGLKLDIDEVKAEAHGLNVGRPHIAKILQKKGYVRSSRAAFLRYLSDEKLEPIESSYYHYKEVIQTVKGAGGVIILAHPGRLFTLDECKKFMAAGVDGLEVFHPSHIHKVQQAMEELAQKNHLLMTGGSDFHGAKKDYYRHFGTLAINQDRVDKLRTLAEQRKKMVV